MPRLTTRRTTYTMLVRQPLSMGRIVSDLEEQKASLEPSF